MARAGGCETRGRISCGAVARHCERLVPTFQPAGDRVVPTLLVVIARRVVNQHEDLRLDLRSARARYVAAVHSLARAHGRCVARLHHRIVRVVEGTAEAVG